MILCGLMSGTSADGTDAAVVEVLGQPGNLSVRLIHYLGVPHPPELRRAILAACRPETGRVDALSRLNFALAEQFARVALQAVGEAGLDPAQVEAIGSHGQTVWHQVDSQGRVENTLQIGCGAVIAEHSGILTVTDFRTRDVAAGGQGAPLISYVDYLLLTCPDRTRAVQNIGGIGNVTLLPAAARPEQVIAFDTGPGNMLIDDAAGRATDGAWSYDYDGALAAQGQVDETWLAKLLSHPYFSRRPPKTTGRELFGAVFAAQTWEEGVRRGLPPRNIVATVTQLTVDSIALAYEAFLPPIAEVIVGGGGTRNPTLIALLRARLAPVPVLVYDELGLNSAAKEAIGFALLAYETLHNRPGNLPSVTGAAGPRILGAIYPA